MFAWWGRTVYHYRFIVIAVMVGLCLVGGFFGMSLGKHVTQSGFYDDGSQSVKASVLGDDVYGRDRRGHIVAIFNAPEGKTVDDPDWSKKIADELEQVQSRPPRPGAGLGGLSEGVTSPDPSAQQAAKRTRPCGARPPRTRPERSSTSASRAMTTTRSSTTTRPSNPICEARRRQGRAGRAAAAGQRADRHHRQGPEARRSAGVAAGHGRAVLRLRRRGRRLAAGRSSAGCRSPGRWASCA